MSAVKELLNAANCFFFFFHVRSYSTALLPGLVGFFTFFIVKTEENLELEMRPEMYFVHVFICIEPDLL